MKLANRGGVTLWAGTGILAELIGGARGASLVAFKKHEMSSISFDIETTP